MPTDPFASAEREIAFFDFHRKEGNIAEAPDAEIVARALLRAKPVIEAADQQAVAALALRRRPDPQSKVAYNQACSATNAAVREYRKADHDAR